MKQINHNKLVHKMELENIGQLIGLLESSNRGTELQYYDL